MVPVQLLQNWKLRSMLISTCTDKECMLACNEPCSALCFPQLYESGNYLCQS
jgi:hypothetical protein